METIRISSSKNEKIKEITALLSKSKTRKERGEFVVEGIKMFSEIPNELLERIYASESFLKDEEKKTTVENKAKESGAELIEVPDFILDKISDTVTPQGIMAIVKMPKQFDYSLIPDGKCTVMVLEDVRDPGNLGTIIRTGEGAGVCAVIMSSECADPFNPKVIRSTMGSIFRVPLLKSGDLKEELKKLSGHGITSYAAHLKGEILSKEAIGDRCAFLIGNESRGLSKELSDGADKLIKIPMEGKLESLNAAISAAILMYTAKL